MAFVEEESVLIIHLALTLEETEALVNLLACVELPTDHPVPNALREIESALQEAGYEWDGTNPAAAGANHVSWADS